MKILCVCVSLMSVFFLLGCAQDAVRDFDEFRFNEGPCRGHVSLDIWSGQIAEGDVHGLFSIYFQFEDANGYVLIDSVEIKDEVGHTHFHVSHAQLETEQLPGSDIIYTASLGSERKNYPFTNYRVSGRATYHRGHEGMLPLTVSLDGEIRTRIDKRNSFLSRF